MNRFNLVDLEGATDELVQIILAHREGNLGPIVRLLRGVASRLEIEHFDRKSRPTSTEELVSDLAEGA
jgi:hypothetical protein